MNLQPLFTTSRVITAVYRIASTTLLLLYMARRIKDGRRDSRTERRASKLGLKDDFDKDEHDP